MLYKFISLITLGTFVSCSSHVSEKKEEQIVATAAAEQTSAADSSLNSIQGNVSFAQVPSSPNAVILTGMPDHRLITVYKSRKDGSTNGSSYKYSRSSYEYNEDGSDEVEHFMPGIDILYGYNLLNIAHYDLKTGNLNYLFDHPVLIKTLYYPSFIQDSLNKIPVNRNFYLVSVCDEDTNKDTLINKKDLRRFYLFDESSKVKTQLIPPDYSVIRSQYDSRNDVMYVFAGQDADKNGTREKKEPIHIFWIDLKNPAKAKRMY